MELEDEEEDDESVTGYNDGQTAIIFEWDDTILCTSTLKQYEYLVQNTEISLPKHLCQKLEKLDQVAHSMLLKAKSLGHVYIVTYGEEGRV